MQCVKMVTTNGLLVLMTFKILSILDSKQVFLCDKDAFLYIMCFWLLRRD